MDRQPNRQNPHPLEYFRFPSKDNVKVNVKDNVKVNVKDIVKVNLKDNNSMFSKYKVQKFNLHQIRGINEIEKLVKDGQALHDDFLKYIVHLIALCDELYDIRKIDKIHPPFRALGPKYIELTKTYAKSEAMFKQITVLHRTFAGHNLEGYFRPTHTIALRQDLSKEAIDKWHAFIVTSYKAITDKHPVFTALTSKVEMIIECIGKHLYDAEKSILVFGLRHKGDWEWVDHRVTERTDGCLLNTV